MYLVHKLYYFNIMIEQSLDSVDNQNNEPSENKLEEIVSEINKSIPDDIKRLNTSQLEDMRKDLKELPYQYQP